MKNLAQPTEGWKVVVRIKKIILQSLKCCDFFVCWLCWCVSGVWGPHLIVVPTSVMLNWEMELKKWCPAFKILTYYGTPKERKQKRVVGILLLFLGVFVWFILSKDLFVRIYLLFKKALFSVLGVDETKCLPYMYNLLQISCSRSPIFQEETMEIYDFGWGIICF